MSIEPNTAYVLLALGMGSIYVEFLRPGLVLPGAIGGLVVAVSLYHLLQFPIQAPGAVSMIVSLVLLGLEGYLWPGSKGALGAAGAAALAWGACRLIEGPARIHPVAAIAVSLPFSAATVFLLTAAIRARLNKL